LESWHLEECVPKSYVFCHPVSARAHVFNKLLTKYPDIQALSNAERNELEKILSRIGYHKGRAKILVEMASYILTRYHGEIPVFKEDFLAVP
jgi:endonuclease III